MNLPELSNSFLLVIGAIAAIAAAGFMVWHKKQPSAAEASLAKLNSDAIALMGKMHDDFISVLHKLDPAPATSAASPPEPVAGSTADLITQLKDEELVAELRRRTGLR